MQKKLKYVTVLSLVMALNGCSSYWDMYGLKHQTVLPPAYPVDNPAPPKSNGTIYQPGHEISLYDDRIAARVGDILTIRLEETTQGQKKTKTKTTKTQTNKASVPTFFGGVTDKYAIATSSDLEFDGEGEANEQNKLNGTVSVTVMRVLSNGNLMVQGESWITINQGREYVRLSGIVRREDIEPNNTVSSQRVADARIAYSGNGQVADTSRGGFLSQMMYKFFPF